MPRLSYDGVEFPYEDTSCGKATVTFLHPFGGSIESLREQRSFFDDLQYRVFLYDCRGHGRNSGSAQRSGTEYTLGLFANDLGALLSHVDPAIHKTHLVGASMGGMVALEYALAHPERIGKLVLVGCTADAFLRSGRKYENERRRIKRKREAEHRKVEREGISALISEKIECYFGKPCDAMDTKEKRQCDIYFRGFQDMTKHEYIATDLAILHKRDQTQDLWNLGTHLSVLYIAGSHDFLREKTEEMHEKTPRSELRIIEDAGHFCWLNKPEVFNSIVAEFLER